mmetsp:Transcript_20525/g.43625  ORF Transcript_20525/g.43625 Transcript_20525/m.43625 type:complete len:82 (-) Transcript_20525:201-446(-)
MKIYFDPSRGKTSTSMVEKLRIRKKAFLRTEELNGVHDDFACARFSGHLIIIRMCIGLQITQPHLCILENDTPRARLSRAL